MKIILWLGLPQHEVTALGRLRTTDLRPFTSPWVIVFWGPQGAWVALGCGSCLGMEPVTLDPPRLFLMGGQVATQAPQVPAVACGSAPATHLKGERASFLCLWLCFSLHPPLTLSSVF